MFPSNTVIHPAFWIEGSWWCKVRKHLIYSPLPLRSHQHDIISRFVPSLSGIWLSKFPISGLISGEGLLAGREEDPEAGDGDLSRLIDALFFEVEESKGRKATALLLTPPSYFFHAFDASSSYLLLIISKPLTVAK